MVTPLHHGQVDFDGAAACRALRGCWRRRFDRARHDREGGLLTDVERLQVAAATLEAVQGTVPVIAGVGGVATHAVCEQVRRLERLDLAGYLVPPPYYLRVSDEGIAWHMRSVASHTARPLMLYNVPKRTGCTISPDLTWRLAAHPQIVALKECDAAGCARWQGRIVLTCSVATTLPCSTICCAVARESCRPRPISGPICSCG
jgi:4-hydroxy-tetrahydrodipicolinate synthase